MNLMSGLGPGLGLDVTYIGLDMCTLHTYDLMYALFIHRNWYNQPHVCVRAWVGTSCQPVSWSYLSIYIHRNHYIIVSQPASAWVRA